MIINKQVVNKLWTSQEHLHDNCNQHKSISKSVPILSIADHRCDEIPNSLNAHSEREEKHKQNWQWRLHINIESENIPRDHLTQYDAGCISTRSEKPAQPICSMSQTHYCQSLPQTLFLFAQNLVYHHYEVYHYRDEEVECS